MPSYNFTNQENREFFDPKLVGDFIVEVVGCEFGVTKDRGDDKMELMVIPDGSTVQIYETLTFTEKTAWKIDTFVKSANLLIDGKPPVLNQPIEFTEPMVVGLRAWVTLYADEYPVGSKKFRNKIRVWITNKEKLAKRVVETEQAESDPDWGA